MLRVRIERRRNMVMRKIRIIIRIRRTLAKRKVKIKRRKLQRNNPRRRVFLRKPRFQLILKLKNL
jgi:hypothetical protein